MFHQHALVKLYIHIFLVLIVNNFVIQLFMVVFLRGRNVSARSLKFRNIATKYKVDLCQPNGKVPQTTSISVYFVVAICT